ncbi:MAG: hypothetical protein CFE34_01495 [Rhodobacteraceae bacterium PARR1]|nr:MAG: hypothetical protein CFE34_01495 [Rhodobacteraceae bacterium PARR1]
MGWRTALRAVQRRRALSTAQALPQGQVTLARIIGNDLYPRHADGQALRNLDLILTAEPACDGWDKLFILNRWFDAAAADRAAQVIGAAGHRVINIPFDAASYAKALTDWRFLGPDPDRALARLGDFGRARADRARLWAVRAKLAAAIGLNDARNLALTHGRDWTLVLDGGCFVPEHSLAALRRDLATPTVAPCLVIPMLRLGDGDLTRPPRPDWREEPQVALHQSARLRFDPRFPYGLRDKTALLTALGVPGAWDDWARDPFLPAPEPTPDRHRFKRASAAVLRLPSGGRLEEAGAHRSRHQARTAAIFATIAHLDRLTGAADAALTRRLLQA